MYHSKGSFTFKDVYNLPIYLRKFYIKRLTKQYKEENDAIQKQQKQSQKTIPKLNIPKR